MIKKILVFLLVFQAANVFSNERAWDLPPERDSRAAVVPGLIAAGEILFSNAAFMAFNHYVTKSLWAVPTRESIHGNFTTAWQWEDVDGFTVNQIGHPYQGSLKYTAGRVNGFGFYQNTFFSVFGSLTWETLFENNHASINDFYTTVPASLSVGEILYRLYVEAHSAGVPAPLAFFISPMTGLHRLVSGWEPPDSGRNLHELRVFLGGGYTGTDFTISTTGEELFSFTGPFVHAGLKLSYGNPFEQDTNVPFRHFDIALLADTNPRGHKDWRIISDGYLLSFSPVYTQLSQMSTGLSLNMDVLSLGEFDRDNSTINQYSNALNWTIKYQHLFSQNTSLHIKSHTGFTFFGVSRFYSHEVEHEMTNYGYGLNSKLFFNLSNRYLGRLELDLLGFVQWRFPGTSTLSQGTVYWLFSDLTYSRLLTERISLGITGSIAREWGNFGSGEADSEFPNTRKRNDSVKMFIAWCF